MDALTATFEGIKALAGVAAVVIAGYGLYTWRRQLRGTVEYDTARRLYRAVLEARDAIASVRNPFISVGEMLEAFKEADTKPLDGDVTKDKRTDQFVYQRRWQAVTKAMTTLRVELLEAEVLWGSEALRDAERQLGNCVADLMGEVMLHLRDKDRGHTMSSEQFERNRDILYGGGNETDVFAKRLGAAVSSFETAVRPHLGRP